MSEDAPPPTLPPVGPSSMTLEDYKKKHAASIADPSAFWAAEATARLDWFQPFVQSLQGSLDNGDVTWFAGGKLNMCYNALDRHVIAGKGDQTALICAGDEIADVRKLTFHEMQRSVCQIANALLAKGVKKGDVVTIYMPMIPELAMTILACARIGALHSVVFAGFSAEALAQRIAAASSKYVMTADVGLRGGKRIHLLNIVRDAVAKTPDDLVDHVMVWERFFYAEDNTPPELQGKELRMHVLTADQRPYCPCAVMDAEDPLFLLYTSGSTGQPKGLLHTTGGYALYAAFTTATSFDLKPDDPSQVFACVADCGWITGHTYVVYGPLLNACTTLMFESTPVYPTPARYWQLIEEHGVTHFYTAPTAIRLLMRYEIDLPKKHNLLKTLRVLGTVGEPINPSAFDWYYETVGQGKCTVVDTYWQTETGGHVITNLPGITPMKGGSCTLPMYGIDPVVLESQTGKIVETTEATGVLAFRQPWPGMARTCFQAHGRYMQTYLKVYDGYYFTGDSVRRDADGYHWIIGRVDDVLNVSGHRIGTAEVESALVSHAVVAQAAVVGQPHEIKGQSIAAFCMLVQGEEESEGLTQELKKLVRAKVGGFAAPDLIVVAPSLPMTRSGKIMRRILRKIVCNEVDSLGDTSTLADPSIVDVLIEKVAALRK